MNSGPWSVLAACDQPRNLVERVHDLLAADALVHSDVHALVAEVVHYGQALDVPPAGQAVADEVHVQDHIDGPALVQQHALELQAPLTQRQVRQARGPVRALVVGLVARSTQQVADASVRSWASAPMHWLFICSSVHLPLRIALPLGCADSPLPWYGWRIAGQTSTAGFSDRKITTADM